MSNAYPIKIKFFILTLLIFSFQSSLARSEITLDRNGLRITNCPTTKSDWDTFRNQLIRTLMDQRDLLSAGRGYKPGFLDDLHQCAETGRPQCFDRTYDFFKTAFEGFIQMGDDQLEQKVSIPRALRDRSFLANVQRESTLPAALEYLHQYNQKNPPEKQFQFFTFVANVQPVDCREASGRLLVYQVHDDKLTTWLFAYTQSALLATMRPCVSENIGVGVSFLGEHNQRQAYFADFKPASNHLDLQNQSPVVEYTPRAGYLNNCLMCHKGGMIAINPRHVDAFSTAQQIYSFNERISYSPFVNDHDVRTLGPSMGSEGEVTEDELYRIMRKTLWRPSFELWQGWLKNDPNGQSGQFARNEIDKIKFHVSRNISCRECHSERGHEGRLLSQLNFPFFLPRIQPVVQETLSAYEVSYVASTYMPPAKLKPVTEAYAGIIEGLRQRYYGDLIDPTLPRGELLNWLHEAECK